MKVIDQIHYLLNHLTKAEKKQFSQLADTTAPYYHLYKLLNHTNQVADEAELAGVLGLQTTDRAFVHAKTYLLKCLMEVVGHHDGEGSLRLNLQKQLYTAHVLYAKDAKMLAKQILEKWIPKALDSEMYDILLPMLELEQQLLDQEFANKPSLLALQHNRQLFMEATSAYSALQEYRKLYLEINERVRKEALISLNTERKEYFLNHELLRPPTSGATVVKLYYHMLSLLVHMHYGLFDTSLTHAEQVIHTLQKPENRFLDNHPEILHRAYNNIQRIYYWAGRYTQCLEVCQMQQDYLNKTQNIPETQYVQAKQNLYNFYLITYSELRRWNDLIKMVPEVESFMADKKEKLTANQYFIIFYNLAYGYFFTGQYSLAMKKLNTMLEQGEGVLRKEMYHFSLLFSLYIRLEMQDWDLLSYEVKNVRRYYTSRRSLSAFETTCLDYLHLCLQQERVVIPEGLTLLKQRLTELSKDPLQIAGLKYLDLLYWADQKLNELETT